MVVAAGGDEGSGGLFVEAVVIVVADYVIVESVADSVFDGSFAVIVFEDVIVALEIADEDAVVNLAVIQSVPTRYPSPKIQLSVMTKTMNHQRHHHPHNSLKY